MAKHFMSILGNTLYAICDYTYEEEYIRTTPYVQTAVIKRFLSDVTEDDRITIFLTEDAEKKNWNNRIFTPKEEERAEKLGYEIGKEKVGLNTEIIDLLQDMNKSKVSEKVINPVREIPEGKTKESLYELFSVIFNEIRDGDEIYFDITNSFRFMPMMVMTILNYAQTLKNIAIKGIYYGEYDPIAYDYSTNRCMPILDISMFQNILELSKASEVFVKHGIAEPIKDVVTKSCNNKILSKIKDSISKLDNLTKCIQSARGKMQKGETKSIHAAYKMYDRKRESFASIEDGYVEIIRPLYDYVNRNVQRFDVDDSYEIGMATIDWCIQYKQIQQGYTALEETITTKACKFCEMDENNPSEREKVKYLMMKSIKREEEENKKCTELSEEDISEKIPKKLIELSRNVSTQRNSLNHFGYDKASINGGVGYDTFEKTLCSFRNELKEI